MTKFFAAVLFAVAVTADARIMRMSRGSSCSCHFRVQRERDEAVKKQNEAADNFNKLSELVTMTNCNPGYSFNYDNSVINMNSVKCEKCPENHYRMKNNSTCLHCPEGFVSSEGSTKCKRAGEHDTIHTLCEFGSVVGNNPFAEHRNSCKKCNKYDREYMPYYNNADNCLICPAGSVITRDSNCIKCPIGYYENNNKCVECDVKTFNDIEGAMQCKVCNNDRAVAYESIGGTNCEDSALFNMANNVNKYINADVMTTPIISGMQIGSAIVYNNRKFIQQISTIGTFMGIGVAAFISG